MQNSEWSIYYRPIFKVTLIDGTHARGYLMGRKVMGKWQYRLPTELEIIEFEDEFRVW